MKLEWVCEGEGDSELLLLRSKHGSAPHKVMIHKVDGQAVASFWTPGISVGKRWTDVTPGISVGKRWTDVTPPNGLDREGLKRWAETAYRLGGFDET